MFRPSLLCFRHGFGYQPGFNFQQQASRFLATKTSFSSLLRPIQRGFADEPTITLNDLKHIRVEKLDNGVAKVIMNSPPVNSMTKEFMKELTEALRLLEEDDLATKGLLLTSGLGPQIFSAGLDLKTMYQPTEEVAKEFWSTLHDLFHRLYMSPFPIVAVINGHAPAGGCFLSLCCDSRVMAAGKAVIGLNEVKLGIVPPWWFGVLMKETVGPRQAEKHLQLGSLLTAEQALQIGLVDFVSENPEQVALEELQKFMKIPPTARVHSKMISRQPLDTIVDSGKSEDVENFWNYIRTDTVQKGLQQYLESLKKKTQ